MTYGEFRLLGRGHGACRVGGLTFVLPASRNPTARRCRPHVHNPARYLPVYNSSSLPAARLSLPAVIPQSGLPNCLTAGTADSGNRVRCVLGPTTRGIGRPVGKMANCRADCRYELWSAYRLGSVYQSEHKGECRGCGTGELGGNCPRVCGGWNSKVRLC